MSGFNRLGISPIGRRSNWRNGSPITPPSGSFNPAMVLHLDAGFADTSPNNFTVTNTGVTISTATKKWGAGSGSFNGSSFLTLPSSTIFNRGTGNWCAEIWVNANTGSSAAATLRNIFTAPGADPTGLGWTTSRRLSWYSLSSGNSIDNSVPQLAENTFHYIAVSKNAGMITVWVNNAAYAIFPNTDTHDFSNWLIGSNQFDSKWLGFMDDFRLTAATRTISAIPTGPFPDS